MDMTGIDFSRRVVVSDRVIAKRLEDEMVLLDLASENYFGLNVIASAMWQELTTSDSIEVAYENLLEQYEVEPLTLRNDLENLLGQLLESRIIELSVT